MPTHPSDRTSPEDLVLALLAIVALGKTATAVAAFAWLQDSPGIWEGGSPLVVHLVALVGFGLPAALVLARSWHTGEMSIALVLACSAAAYATRPLRLLGWDGASGLRIEAFAGLGLWCMVLALPRPLEEGWGRRLTLGAAGWSAACGLFALTQDQFLPVQRLWGTHYFQIWDLTIPAAGVAAIVLTVRSIRLGSDLGPIVLVSLGPLVGQLMLEAMIPAYTAWSSEPPHRALLTGVVLSALLTLPLWLLVSRPGRPAERNDLAPAVSSG